MALVAWIRSLVKKKAEVTHELRRETMAIAPTQEMLAEDEITRKQAKCIFRGALSGSPGVLPGSVDSLVERVFGLPGRGVFRAFSERPQLSLEEKRGLGLNTRSKYWHDLIEFFDPQSFVSHDPKQTIDSCLQNAWNIAFRDKQTRKARSFGCDFVKIDSLGECDCYRMQRFPIDSMPQMPHEKCPLRSCMCQIYPVLPLLEDRDASG